MAEVHQCRTCKCHLHVGKPPTERPSEMFRCEVPGCKVVYQTLRIKHPDAAHDQNRIRMYVPSYNEDMTP